MGSGGDVRRALGLEAKAAPLAWGCEVGDEETRVAVVEEAFQAVGDLLANVAPQSRGDVGVNNTTDHGTKVASMLAARGNNGQGITGAMWRADLDGIDAETGDDRVPLLLDSHS